MNSVSKNAIHFRRNDVSALPDVPSNEVENNVPSTSIAAEQNMLSEKDTNIDLMKGMY